MKKHLRYLLTLLLAMVASVGWAQTYSTVATFRSSDVVGTSSYKAYDTNDWSLSFGGNNYSVGTNKNNSSKCVITSAYGTDANTANNAVSIVSKNKIDKVSQITFTYDGGSGYTGKIYLAYSTDNSTWNAITLTSGTQGSDATTGMTFQFTEIASAYYAIILDRGTNANSNWRWDYVVVTFDELQGGSGSAATTSVTINSSGITNTDIFAGTAAGRLTATVKDDTDTAIEGATVTWTSSKENVATIAADGTVTLVAEGTTTITAAYAGVENVYRSSSATYELTVTDSDPDKPGSENNPYTVAEALENTPATGTTANVYVKGIVSGFYSSTITGDGSNYRYYISDDGTTTNQMMVYKGKGLNNVAFANDDDLLIGDEVVIKGGLTTYKSTKEIAENNYIVSLNRNTTKVAMPTFSPAAGTYSEVQNVEITTATDGATIYYTTDGTDPDATSTEYTAAIPVAQTMTIKAIAVKEGMTDSEIATAEYIIKIITVNPKNIGSNYFVKVTDAADLEDGDAILIVNEGNNKAMSTTQNTNNRPSAVVTITDDAIIPGSNVQKLVLTDAGDGKWMFCVGTSADAGFLTSGTTSTSNQLKTTTDPDDNANATIEVTDGNAAIVFQGTGTKKTLRFNGASGQMMFSCYGSGQQDVQIYKEVERTSVNVTIGETGYATLYYSDVNLTVPEGVTAKTYKANGTALVELDSYNTGNVIPAGTGVVLNGAQGDYTFAITTESGTTSKENMLRGSDEAAETTGGAKYYMLSLAATGGNETVGFYYKAENGAAFMNGAHKAYLAVPEGTEAKATGYAFNEVTGINDITREQVTDGVWYTIDGKRLNGEPTVKGIYVVNGKKVVIK